MSILSFSRSLDSKIKKELFFFVLAGGGAVMVDFLAYFFMSAWLNVNLAKGLSFALGSLVAYFVNNYLTFSVSTVNRVNLSKFASLYLFTFFCNVGVNFVIFHAFGDKVFGFLVATSVSTVLNFLGQKFWVFKK